VANLGPDLAAGVPVSDIPDCGMKTGHIGGTKALLARLGDEVFSIGATCSHLGGPLHQGLVVDHSVRCPWHHACFSLRSGEPLAAPAFDPLPHWEVEVEDSVVRVRHSTPLPTPSRLRHNTRSDERFIVIGGGAAGFAAVDMLLRRGFAGEIAMISDDMAPPYDRTLLTKDYLDGRFGDDHLPLSNHDLFSEDRVRLMLRTKIARIDPTARQVMLDNGEVLSYSKLLLATGAAPKRPDFRGSELPHVKLLRSLEDCRDILAAAQAGNISL
jgi:apoptosis-inducing factor 3